MSTSEADQIRQIAGESSGVLDVFIVSPAGGIGLVNDAMAGSERATWMLQAINQTAVRIKKTAHKAKPSLCTCCPRAVRKIDDVAFGLLIPSIDDPSGAVGFVVCPKCRILPDVDKRIQAELRKVWPGLRSFVVTHHEGGQA